MPEKLHQRTLTFPLASSVAKVWRKPCTKYEESILGTIGNVETSTGQEDWRRSNIHRALWSASIRTSTKEDVARYREQIAPGGR
jgi:hypothetical protein